MNHKLIELVFSANFVGVFADLHNSISELATKTAQKVCANKRRFQWALLILGGFQP